MKSSAYLVFRYLEIVDENWVVVNIGSKSWFAGDIEFDSENWFAGDTKLDSKNWFTGAGDIEIGSEY
jgi:hypothetical protein